MHKNNIKRNNAEFERTGEGEYIQDMPSARWIVSGIMWFIITVCGWVLSEHLFSILK